MLPGGSTDNQDADCKCKGTPNHDKCTDGTYSCSDEVCAPYPPSPPDGVAFGDGSGCYYVPTMNEDGKCDDEASCSDEFCEDLPPADVDKSKYTLEAKTGCRRKLDDDVCIDDGYKCTVEKVRLRPTVTDWTPAQTCTRAHAAPRI